MVSPVSVDNPQTCRVVFDGVQTVRNIQAAYDRLTEAIAEYQTIEVDCDGISELDLSLIQLLLAAKRSADKSGKSLSLAAPAAGKLRSALDRAGFLGPGKNDSNHADAFWLKGSSAA